MIVCSKIGKFRHRDRILDSVPWASQERVLDVGAGRGLLRNLDREGVPEKTEMRNQDAQKMSFPDASFEIVLSDACLHNIDSAPGRAQACREIAPVLKPGGGGVISDFQPMCEYRDAFSRVGRKAHKLTLSLDIFPPLRIVTARKHRRAMTCSVKSKKTTIFDLRAPSQRADREHRCPFVMKYPQ